MGFFSHFRQRIQPITQVDGLLGYYGLGAWWLATFTPREREEVEYMWEGFPFGECSLTRGQVASNPLSPAEFLLVMTHRIGDASVKRRVLAKARELNGGALPGRGHGTCSMASMDRAKQLIQEGKLRQADSIVDKAFTAYERASRIGLSLTTYDLVPPAPYWEFAVLYRKHKDYAREVQILERFAAQPHETQGASGRNLERLAKARALLAHAAHDDQPEAQE